MKSLNIFVKETKDSFIYLYYNHNTKKFHLKQIGEGYSFRGEYDSYPISIEKILGDFTLVSYKDLLYKLQLLDLLEWG